eukprot:193506-Chlamydomonas_euryale.AAC.3
MPCSNHRVQRRIGLPPSVCFVSRAAAQATASNTSTAAAAAAAAADADAATAAAKANASATAPAARSTCGVCRRQGGQLRQKPAPPILAKSAAREAAGSAGSTGPLGSRYRSSTTRQHRRRRRQAPARAQALAARGRRPSPGVELRGRASSRRRCSTSSAPRSGRCTAG